MPQNMHFPLRLCGMMGMCECNEGMESTAREGTFIPEHSATGAVKNLGLRTASIWLLPLPH